MLAQLVLRVVDVAFVAGRLASPDFGMLPAHMPKPFFGGFEENMSVAAFLEEADVWVDILQDVSSVSC